MSTIHRLNAFLLAVILVGSAWGYLHLPERIPAHVGADGTVTRWTETSLLSWFLLPLLTLAVAGLNYAIAAWLPSRPHLVNLPGKREFLALPPERRAPIVARMQEFLYAFTVPLTLLMGLVQWSLYRSAMGTGSRLDFVLVLLTSVVMTPAMLIAFLPRIQRAVREQVEAHRREGEGREG